MNEPDDECETTGPGEMEVAPGTLRALRNPVCRFTVYALDGRRLPLDVVADVVVGWRAANAGGMATGDDRERVRSELHHRHLPALADAGLVEYDPDTGAVALASLSAPTRQLIEWLYRHEAENTAEAAPPGPPAPEAFARSNRLEFPDELDLEGFLAAVEDRHRTVTVYAPEPPSGIVTQLSDRNTTVEHEVIPPGGPAEFLLVHDRAGFVGSAALDTLDRLADPAVPDPTVDPTLPGAERALLGLLEDTLFASLERRQLLTASREIEDRAQRVGAGSLHVGFQEFSKLRHQWPLYRHLATETDLDIHLYGREDWAPPEVSRVTYHGDLPGVGRFWFLAFDGGPVRAQRCALVAEERTPGRFYGCWTYDPDLVGGLMDWLASAAG
ncbi:DUF7344 domain-containing protein [Haloglomus litoreum]|uniref:DUF7344 domain-containing protein n=1 Tax=Haloglomus litoreum TaxID=3034026 RepID=UPI0023E7EBBE|nr:DICT sensory domain-containing protein [Haloglomus sp. DT116]